MKKTILFLAALATVSAGWAQNLSKNEAKSLQAFISQPAANGGTNAQALGFTGNNVADLPDELSSLLVRNGVTPAALGDVVADWL